MDGREETVTGTETGPGPGGRTRTGMGLGAGIGTRTRAGTGTITDRRIGGSESLGTYEVVIEMGRKTRKRRAVNE